MVGCLWGLFLIVPDIGSGAGGQGGCSCVCRDSCFAWLWERTKPEWKIPEWWADKKRKQNDSHWAQLTMVGHQHIEQTQSSLAWPPMLSVQRRCLSGEAWIK
jgi:hypothetical protein